MLASVVITLLMVVSASSIHAAPVGARDFLASIRPSPELQEFLDRTVDDLARADARIRQTDFRIALLDLSHEDTPRLAQRRGDVPIYPASVVKFVYLMAAYAFQEQAQVRIDEELDTQLTHMIRESSNQATRRVFAQLTATDAGPELPPEAYAAFRERRLAVTRWLATLGIDDLHCVNPTYDGDGDLFGRDAQFLRDRTVRGGLGSRDGEFPNRNGMTANGTARLLALLATDRALSPDDSATVRRRMRRNPIEQPHLVHRIAGGAARLSNLAVYAKSGTWGPIYADAGIVRNASGQQIVLVVFTQATPPYRGDFIADLTARCAAHLLEPGPRSARP